MADTDYQTIAEVYAQSLLDLATAQGLEQVIDQEFSELAAYIKIDPEFRAFFESQSIDSDNRSASLDRMFQGKMNDLLLSSLQIINKNGRSDLIRYVQAEYRRLYVAAQNIVEVNITTAEPLSEALRQKILDLMTRRTSKSVSLIERVDSAILGGMILRVGDEQIDTTIAHQLQLLHNRMIEHGTQQILSGANMFEDATEF